MKLAEIKRMLDTLGIPVAYMCFKKPQKLPFLVYYEAGAEIKGADNYNLYRDVTVYIEYYFEKKDVEFERRLEELFRDTELERQPDNYLKDEDMFMAVYSFNTIQKLGG